MSNRKIRLGITQGDINGVGYEVILKALADQRILELFTPVIYGSRHIAEFYRQGAALPDLNILTLQGDASQTVDERINLVEVTPHSVKAEPGKESKEAGAAAVAALDAAVADLRQGYIDALVTAPINKHVIQSDSFRFPGHTEYLHSRLADHDQRALMILCNDDLRVALVTIHTPISEISAAITKEAVEDKIADFNLSLTRDFALPHPHIAVLALNPHAGDGGLLGTEETAVIAPAIAAASAKGINCFGPFAADGFWGSGQWQKFDGVLAMYHDQGLAPFKTLAMHSGVNYTAGLDYVRTSPDHGTGFDIAGTNQADPESMRCAMYRAVDIVRNRRFHAQAVRNPLRKQYVEKNKKDNVVLDLTKSSDE